MSPDAEKTGENTRREFLIRSAVVGITGMATPGTLPASGVGIDDPRIQALAKLRANRTRLENMMEGKRQLYEETIQRLSTYTVQELRRLDLLSPLDLPRTPQQAANWSAIRYILCQRKCIPSTCVHLSDHDWEEAKQCERLQQTSPLHQQNPQYEYARIAQCCVGPFERIQGLIAGLIRQKETAVAENISQE